MRSYVDKHREEFLKMCYGRWSRQSVSLVLLPFLLLAYGCKGDPQAKKAAHMQKGEAYVAQEKYTEAVIEYRNAIQLDPKDAQAYYKLALAYLKQGEPQLQNAFQALRKSVALDPALINAQLKLGEMYLLAKKYNEAQERANFVLQHDPNNIEAHTMLSGAYAGRKELPQAIDTLRKALSLDPKLIKTYLNVAFLYELNKDVRAAEKTYQEALAVDPNAVATHTALGTVYATQQQFDKAEKAFRKALEIEPRNVNIHLQLANFYASRRQAKEA